MSDIAALVADNLDVWTGAIERKSGVGRGGGKRISLYGIDRLRALILDLAVRGKLVPQDAGDEPASELVARSTTALRAALARESFRVPAKIKPSTESYIRPAGWATTRLGALTRIINGRAYKKPELISSGAPVLRVGNLFTSKEWYYSDLILEDDKYIEDGDLIYAWSASFGPFIWNGGRVIYHYHIWKLEPYSEMDISREFLRLFLQNETDAIKASGHGIAMLHMTKERMEQLSIDLPPRAEQQRIVDKVEELMGLRDALERESAGAMAAHQELVEILLATLVSSADAADLVRDWARLGSHFDTLFTTDASIDALKQTILDLAVRGRIVEQDSEEEPAAAFLKRMNGNQKTLVRIRTGIDKFDVPSGWEWVPFGSYATDISTGPFGTMIHKSDYISGGIPLINPSHMINDRIIEDVSISVSNTKADELSSYRLKEGDIVFARRGDVGRLAVVSSREDGWLCGTGSFRASFASFLVQPYLQKFFRSRFARILLGAESVGATMSNLNQSILMQVPIPVPPLAEQHRIVAKVDALMALCDALKGRLAEAAQTQRHLADAITQRAAA